mgnify:CR=1 FL=1
MRNKHFFLLLVCVLLTLAIGCACALGEEYKTLKSGSEGKDVKKLKVAMYWLGYFNNPNLSDYYNGTTVERVKQLQKNNGLEETGIATPELQELIFSGNCIPCYERHSKSRPGKKRARHAGD